MAISHILGLLQLKAYFKQDLLLVNLSKGLLVGGVTIVDNIKKSLNIDNVVTLKGPSCEAKMNCLHFSTGTAGKLS